MRERSTRDCSCRPLPPSFGTGAHLQRSNAIPHRYAVFASLPSHLTVRPSLIDTIAQARQHRVEADLDVATPVVAATSRSPGSSHVPPGGRAELRFGDLGHPRRISEFLRLDRRRRLGHGRRARCGRTIGTREEWASLVAEAIDEQHAAVAEEVVAIQLLHALGARITALAERGHELLGTARSPRRYRARVRDRVDAHRIAPRRWSKSGAVLSIFMNQCMTSVRCTPQSVRLPPP